jgi:uncharacterized membrane protein
MHDLALIVSVVIATLVEAVEALTIVLAAGLARGWKAARRGTLLGLATVALIILLLGPLLTQFPVELLRLIVGVLSLIFGLSWLRKAILRSSGYKAIHDEDLIFKKELEAAKRAQSKESFVGDWYAFTISYKAVVIEGIEVAFLVITFGALQNKILVAAIAASAACLLVILLGFVIHKPLNKVPENALKFIVGIILTTFGIFWATEGSGFDWTLQDLSLLPILAIVTVSSLLLVILLRLRKSSTPETKVRPSKKPKLPRGFNFLYDFLVGDDWPTAIFIYLTIALAIMGIGFEWLLCCVIVFSLVLRMVLMTNAREPQLEVEAKG